jgi:NAD+ synthetase
MRIALAQINPTVGAIGDNTARIGQAIDRARQAGAGLVVLPELAVVGYPPKDLLLKPAVIEQCEAAIETLAQQCVGIAAIIGYPSWSDKQRGRTLHNTAAYCAEGQVKRRHFKSLLPTYDVFDEHRYFEPGPAVDLTPCDGHQLGISICEDLWNEQRMFTRQLYHDNPIDRLAELGADVFVNCAASPFVVRKQAFRQRLMSHIARRNQLPLVYCNQVGGNDELIFDGASCAFDASGQLIAQGKAFAEDLVLVDLPLQNAAGAAAQAAATTGEASSPDQRPAHAGPFENRGDTSTSEQHAPSAERGVADNGSPYNRIETYEPGLAAAFHALTVGLRDYVRKCGFKSVVLGLSGGIDSAVTAAVCVAALGPQQVRGITMPSRYSSAGASDDSQALAANLGIAFDSVPIESPHNTFESLLEPYFAGYQRDVTEENLQARIRGTILMAFSNKLGALLVTTGNKSEIAVGYCTLYGDMAGGLAVLSDVPKTMVWDLARWINDDAASPLRQQLGGPAIPESTITKPPSAELREDQKDEDSLPPYDVLDPIIERYVEREHSVERIVEQTGVDRATVLRITRLIDRNEYKRKQMPPGLKITSRAFGFGRRMPIAQRFEHDNGAI